MANDHIHLNGFTMNCVGHQSPGLWKHPDDNSDAYTDLEYWTDLAQTLEEGKFDAVFIADVLGTYSVFDGSRDTAVREAVQTPVNDPLLPIPAMAQVTDHLGFAATHSVTYTKPYMTAKRLSTLDHLTDGRIAWNIVTSYLEDAAVNLGLEGRIEHDERYDLAEEYIEVCYKLWEQSWESDAVVKDPETETFTDPEKVNEINHDGEYFTVPGPHLTEPSPQRTPVLYQAGQSDRGREYAAKHAEAVFTFQPTVDTARSYVEDVRERAAAYGRSPDHLHVFAAIAPIVAPTEEEAQRKYAELEEYVSHEGALALVGGWTDIDFAEYDPDERVEHIESDAIQGIVDSFTKADPDREWTVGEVATFIGVGGIGVPVVGTPAQIADEMERWVDEAGIDGFNLTEVLRSGTLSDFVEHVVPELQDRGLHREEYTGETLRETMFETGDGFLHEDHTGSAYADDSKRRAEVPKND
ncbi:LLM class flavin-dependent oxidoreductase [Halopenitus persicus]|uniref:FMN-dependent oxidoreductase, nitrilotriacetate monooxygenase family n=1 Tax=Halopenitus persicus TaxID=1048396 RepID=A0A1H3JJ11_9EURY|nr:LLM class flavin-dependent oxidoreductase [Halopenitus persicus]QHS15858.1 LLM class flavin-dependent oxidoreductase [haloarchaeon 3A1-DGR]SDY39204.1 FMN-dependent oxidoreductase, nitrilotriacetate monooxygenase family [Halopenitus persicus]